MRDLIEIHLTSRLHFAILRYTYRHLQTTLPLRAPEALAEALENLLENVIRHAYEQIDKTNITVRFTILPRQLQIDVEDSGKPFDFTPFTSEAIDHSAPHEKGFFRIYDLVDRFWFTILENRGKRFSVVQSFVRTYDTKTGEVSRTLPDKATVLSRLKVRRFHDEDAEGIAQLIYKNYHYTYYKSHFYDPGKIRQLNAEESIVSIVAVYGVRVVGHFALVRAHRSDIAEIAIAAVDPEFKKMGIMNRMFDRIIATAHELKLQAIYGEAIMLHPYSQKANLTHGMKETAISLGEVPTQTEIEHHIKAAQRSGAMVAFLVFNKCTRFLRLPSRYAAMLEATYRDLGIGRTKQAPKNPGRAALEHHINRRISIGFVIVEALPDDEELDAVLDLLHSEHCDMIYADINLHHIESIDETVAMLNRRRFFYSGLFVAFYHNEDYLRLQRKNTKYVDEEQLICYSQKGKNLLEYIKEDERRVLSGTLKTQ